MIGSGFGGLALAIRLQSAGIDTLILEQRDKPGGRAYVYNDQGFTFDAGPTVITDPSALEELFALSGRRLEDYVRMLPVSPFYRLCWEDGYCFDYANDQAEPDRQIGRKRVIAIDGLQLRLTCVRDEANIRDVTFPHDHVAAIRTRQMPDVIMQKVHAKIGGNANRHS